MLKGGKSKRARLPSDAALEQDLTDAVAAWHQWWAFPSAL
jgi:hypothetical protein